MLHRRKVLLGLLLILVACSDGTAPTRLSLLRAGDVVNGDVKAGAPVVYRTTVKAGDQLAIYFQVPNEPLTLTLLDQSGAAVASALGGHDPAIAQQVRGVITPLLSTDAEYTIEIAAYRTTQESSFRLEAVPFNTRPETGSSSIAVNTIVQEKIDHAADVDQYTLNAVAGQELEVFLQQLDPGTSGSLLARLETDNFVNSVFSTGVPADSDFERSTSGVLIVQTNTQYRLTVSSRFSGYVGPYRVEVRAIDHAPEHVAASLVPGDTLTGESIDYVGDVDDFTLTGAPGTEYNVFLDASGSAQQFVQVEVLGRSDHTVRALPGGTPLLQNATGRIVIPASGSVTLRVRDLANARGAYRLFVARVDHAPEGVAPVIVAGAGAQATTSAIELPGDIDEYSFTLPTATTLNLLLSRGADATGSTLQAEIRSDTGTTPVSSDAGVAVTAANPSTSTTHLTLAPGTYKLRIAGQSSRGDGYRGSYQVQLRTVDSAPEIAAARIAVGDTVRGETLEYAGDIDSFVLPVAPGDTLNVKVLTPGRTNPGIRFAIWDPVTQAFRGGSTFDENNPGGPLQSGRLALEPGDYSLVVQSGSGGAIATEQGGYQLVVDRVSARPEHHAAVIALGDTVSDEPIDYIGDYDDFYLHGQPGSEIVGRFLWNVGATGSVNGLGAFAFVDSTTGAALVGTPSAVAWQETRRVAFPAAGVLRIRVQAASARTGTYSFTTIPISRAPETRAAAFTLGDTVSEAIDPAADIDEFVFQGTAGQSVDAFLQAPNGLGFFGSVQLELIDLSTDSVLATVAATGGSINLEDFNRRGIVLHTTGSYRVRVQNVGDFIAPANYRFRIAPSP